MVLQVRQPAAVLDLLMDLKIADEIASQQKNSGMQDLFKVFEALARPSGATWKETVRKLTGRGIMYATYPGDKSIVMLDAEDPATLQQVSQLAKSVLGMQTASDRVFYKEWPGLSVWSFDGKQFFACTPGRLIVTGQPEVLKTLFDPGRNPGQRLAAAPLYTAAMKTVEANAAASLFMNMEMLNQYPPAKKALGPGDSAFDVILTGAVKQSLRGSKWLAMSLRLDGRKASLHAATDGKLDNSGAAGFTIPPAEATGILPNLPVPHEIAAATLWRDLGKFYAAKDAMFPEKTSGGILLENFLEIFFTGRDLNADVFSRFNPAVRLVVAGQEYDPKIGTPLTQYPAAALVFRVDQPEEFGDVVEEAWQKAVGLTNFTRGQQALPGLIIDRESHAGVTFTYCYYSGRAEKDRAHLPVRYNVRPALARVGPYVIVSTTDGLAKHLIDAVNKEDARLPAGRSQAHTVTEISSGPALASLMAANRNELVKQNMVEKGLKQQEAESQLNSQIMLLNHLDRAKLTMTATPEGHAADLELHLK
jgi:hypothetical protein